MALAAAAVLLLSRVSSAPPRDGAAAPARAAQPAEPAPAGTLLVFVSGAVVHPGMYHVTASARVADAVASAGGLSPDADTGRLPNLAGKVHDGSQVNVPFVRSGTIAGREAPRLDINSATVDELRSVPGMPAGLPEAIVEYRERWGGFTTLADLRLALGVDRTTASGLAHYLQVRRAAWAVTPSIRG